MDQFAWHPRSTFSGYNSQGALCRLSSSQVDHRHNDWTEECQKQSFPRPTDQTLASKHSKGYLRSFEHTKFPGFLLNFQTFSRLNFSELDTLVKYRHNTS